MAAVDAVAAATAVVVFASIVTDAIFFRHEQQKTHTHFLSLSLSLANLSILFYAILNYNYSVFSCLFLLAVYICGGMNRCVLLLFYFLFFWLFSVTEIDMRRVYECV